MSIFWIFLGVFVIIIVLLALIWAIVKVGGRILDIFDNPKF